MKNIQVYDLPTRLFHWIFAASFLGAFLIAEFIDDKSSAYPYHMLLGLILALTVVFRIGWGLIGTKYARFSSFALNPTELLRYFRDFVPAAPELRSGHNPASSWAAILMMILVLGLAATGLLTTGGGNTHILKELHELFANSLLVMVLLHLAGLAIHTVRHRDEIAFSMIHGRKKTIETGAGIRHSHRGIGVLFAMLIACVALYLGQNYDRGTRSLNLFGRTLQLGEQELRNPIDGRERVHHHDD